MLTELLLENVKLLEVTLRLNHIPLLEMEIVTVFKLMLLKVSPLLLLMHQTSVSILEVYLATADQA